MVVTRAFWSATGSSTERVLQVILICSFLVSILHGFSWTLGSPFVFGRPMYRFFQSADRWVKLTLTLQELSMYHRWASRWFWSFQVEYLSSPKRSNHRATKRAAREILWGNRLFCCFPRWISYRSPGVYFGSCYRCGWEKSCFRLLGRSNGKSWGVHRAPEQSRR